MEVRINMPNETSIVEELKVLSGYTSKNIPGSHDYISITDDEQNIYRQLIDEAIAALQERLKEFKAVISSDVLILQMPITYSQKMNGAITESIKQYIINSAMLRWLDIAQKKESIELYVSKANKAIEHIISMLYVREKPIKRI